MDGPMHDDWLETEFAPDTRLRLQVSRRLYCATSAFQKIEVVETPRFGRVLLLDDVINVTERDEAVYHEMLCHVPMQAHADAQRLLVVGGGDGGIIREAVRYPGLRTAVLAEIDAEVIAASRRWLPGVSCGLDDPRVEVCTTDASAYVRADVHGVHALVCEWRVEFHVVCQKPWAVAPPVRHAPCRAGLLQS